MKITAIEAIHLRVEDPNIGLFDGSYDDCVIRVRTDEGITGIGEVESLAPAIQALIYAAPAHNHARGLRRVADRTRSVESRRALESHVRRNRLYRPARHRHARHWRY